MNADSIAQRTIAPSQTRRRKDTKDSRRHRSFSDTDFADDTDVSDRAPSGDSARTGRAAKARSRGVAAWEGRSSNARACRSTSPHHGSFLRNAHPASTTTSASLPRTEIAGAGLTPALSPTCHLEQDDPLPTCHLERVSPPHTRHLERVDPFPTCHLERVSPRTSRKVPRSAVSRLSLPMPSPPGGTSVAPSTEAPPQPKPPPFLPGIFRLRGLEGRSAQDDMWGKAPAAIAAMAAMPLCAMAHSKCDVSVPSAKSVSKNCDGCDVRWIRANPRSSASHVRCATSAMSPDRP
jgi:hypothetical protein